MGPPAVWVDNLVLAGRRTNSGLLSSGRTRYAIPGYRYRPHDHAAHRHRIAFSYYLYGPASFVTARIMGVDRPTRRSNTPIYADTLFGGPRRVLYV